VSPLIPGAGKKFNSRDALRRVCDGKPNTNAEHRVPTGSRLYDQPNFFTASPKDLESGQRKVEVGPLANYSGESLDGNGFLPDIVFTNPRLAAGWAHTGGQDAHGG
jgi:hypothetical protein